MKKKEYGLDYQLIKAGFRLAINGIFYRHYSCLDTENIPPEGTPVLVAMNHQNCLNDALGVLFAKNDRKFHFIARADAFNIHPLLTRFMYFSGILPVFRLEHQGEEALADNKKTFELAVLALWPSMLCWYLPKHFSDHMGDIMFQSSFQVGLNVLLLLPLTFVLTWLVTGLYAGFWVGLLHALLIGPLCIFEWYYFKLARDVRRDIRFLRQDTTSLSALRDKALTSLKSI